MATVLVLAGCAGVSPRNPDPSPRTPDAPVALSQAPCLSQSDDGLFLICLQHEINDVWSGRFRDTGREYAPPRLSVGKAPGADGAPERDLAPDRAYFSGRSGIHFPDKYLEDVHKAHGTRAHIVLTFTLGHETGHHLQLLIHPRFDAPDVDVERQADCYAGFWARSEADEKRLDVGLFRSAAEAELRRLSEDHAEVLSHGSADQRIGSLDEGLRATDPSACDVGDLTWR